MRRRCSSTFGPLAAVCGGTRADDAFTLTRWTWCRIGGTAGLAARWMAGAGACEDAGCPHPLVPPRGRLSRCLSLLYHLMRWQGGTVTPWPSRHAGAGPGGGPGLARHRDPHPGVPDRAAGARRCCSCTGTWRSCSGRTSSTAGPRRRCSGSGRSSCSRRCWSPPTLLPLDGHSALLSFTGDLVAFAGLLGLGRFALVLAGLDTGSSFEGMGASREVTVSAFAEPALFLCFTVLVLATGELSLAGMLGERLAAVWPVAAAVACPHGGRPVHAGAGGDLPGAGGRSRRPTSNSR